MSLLKNLLALLGIVSSATVSSAAQQPEPMPVSHAANRNEWVDRVTEHYAGVAAGVEINRRCCILSSEDTERLEHDLEAFTEALEEQIRPEFLELTRNTARKLASEEPYNACAAEARQAVTETQEFVAWWLDELEASDR